MAKISDHILDINDIIVPNIIQEIIKSKEFQRLKEIKQLGFVYRSQNNAIHNRFDHCIGTYMLTEKFMSSLEKNTPGLVIPEFYRLCVNIAGLLHDVGHGPFSHFWEFENLSHEENSAKLVEIIFNDIQILDLFFGNPDKAIDLIKAFIIGKKKSSHIEIPEYEYLFEIVNNDQCGIDVDKLDYLIRDNHFVGNTDGIDFNRQKLKDIFENAKVADNRKHIEYKYEDYGKIHYFFLMRKTFHLNIYQTPEVKMNEYLMKEAINCARENKCLYKGKDIYTINGTDKSFLTLTDINILNWLKSLNIEQIQKYMFHFDYKKFTEVPYDKNNRENIVLEVKEGAAFRKMNPENCHFYIGKNQKSFTDDDYYKEHSFRLTN